MAKVTPAIPASGLPVASTAFPAKFTRRGTVVPVLVCARSGRVHVSYRGSSISVGSMIDTGNYLVADQADHSLESLAMLNELISLAKISGNLAAPQTVQVVP